MKEMRRKDKAAGTDEAIQLLTDGEYGVLSTVGVDGNLSSDPAFLDDAPAEDALADDALADDARADGANGHVPEPEPPIHFRFTWDQPPAAAAFRIQDASGIMRRRAGRRSS